MAQVIFESFDTTLRDGAQALGEDHQFKEGAKPDIAHEIATLGTDVIEAGFPATKFDGEEVRSVAISVGNTNYTVRNWIGGEEAGTTQRPPVIAGLSRVRPQDIETTWAAVQDAARPRIHTFVSTDDEHMKAKFAGKTPDDVLIMGRDAIRLAKRMSGHHPGASVEFSAEASTTTDESYLERVAKMSADEGVDVLNMPDSVSNKNPFWMYEFYKKVLGWTMPINPRMTLSAHPHNDYGLAVANSYALFQAATDYASQYGQDVRIQVEGTICGLGERCGNADEIAVVAGGLFKFAGDYAVPVVGSYNPERAVSVARIVMAAANYEVPPKSPIVGIESNVHRSGIHSDGILKGGFEIYTPHDPRFWGHEQAAVHEEGRYQGKSGRQAALANTSTG